MSLMYFTIYHTHDDSVLFIYIHLKKNKSRQIFETITWLNLSVLDSLL